MLKSAGKRKISAIIVFSFVFQLLQNFYFIKYVYADLKKKIEIVKEDIIKDKESNTLSFKVKVKNISEEEIELSKLKLSYWYSDNDIKNEEIIKDWISIDESKVNIEIEKLDKNYKNSNSKINISFGEELENVKNGEEIELNVRLQNKQWENYNQENNYSFTNDIIAEYDGNIIHGKIPEEVQEEEKVIKINSKMYNKQINKDITAIYPWIKIENNGNIELDLSKLEIRYYYTIDSNDSIEEDVIIDWSNIGKEKVVAKINSIDDREDADKYLSLKLNSSDKLTVGKDLEIHSRFNKKDWSNYNQENDYSFNKDATDYVDWNKILVLYDGNIISGEEPEINDGLQLISLEAERRKNVVSLKWDEIKEASYLVEKSIDGNNFVEIRKDLSANVYIDSTDEDLDSIYYYRVIAFDKDGNKIGKSRKIKSNSFKDSDGDALSDDEEIKLGTNPNNSDSDGDGLTDGEEVLINKTNPLNKDTDKDGLGDAFEVYISDTNPLKADTDGNGILDGDEDLDQDGLTISEEFKLGTNPKEADSDFDGINDKDEIYKYKTNPNEKDTDGDGVSDGLEIQLKFDPNNKDSNNNGILDGDEVAKYSYEMKEYQKDDKINVKVDGNFIAKHIDDIDITNMEGMHVMTSNETPGYIGAPYLVKVPNGSKEVEIRFNYDVASIKDGAEPTLYKLDKEKNTLVEVEGQDKTIDGTIVLKLNNDIEKIVPKNEKLEEKDYYINDNFILIDKKEWDKYWETEIKHPTEKGKLDLAFVIDTSGSMSSNDPKKYRVQLAKHFINKKVAEDRIALVGFSSSSSLYQKLTADKTQLLSNVDRLGQADGGTNISAGVDKAIDELKDSKDRNKKIILLTDGEGTFNNSTLENAKKNSIKIYTIGLGTSYDKNLLERIASETGGKYYHVKSGEEIGDITDDIHGDAGNQDMDGDGIPDKEDDKPYEHNIVLGKFDKSDKLFKQTASLAYGKTDKYINQKISTIEGLDVQNIDRILDWRVVESNDSNFISMEEVADRGFGAVVIEKGNKIIISFEGTDFKGDFIGDAVLSDLLSILVGLPSKQLYKAYELTTKVMEKYKGKEIYITGHSLGGWLATKVTGTIIETDINIYSQIPLLYQNKVDKFKSIIKKNSNMLKKSVPIAAPGLQYLTRIQGKSNNIFKEKLFSYKIDSDLVSLFGSDKYLRGNVKFMKKRILDSKCSSGDNFFGHLLGVYYHHFDEFFNPNNFYYMNTMDSKF